MIILRQKEFGIIDDVSSKIARNKVAKRIKNSRKNLAIDKQRFIEGANKSERRILGSGLSEQDKNNKLHDLFKDREAFKSEQSRDKNALLETAREAQKLLPKGKKVSREQFKGVKEKLNLDAPPFYYES